MSNAAEHNAMCEAGTCDHPECVQNRKYIEVAREKYEVEGTLEIDDHPVVARGEDPGAYVQAWVWVDEASTITESDDWAKSPLRQRYENYLVHADTGCGVTASGELLKSFDEWLNS